jgi:NADH-quinone oxidoreductase subunit M
MYDNPVPILRIALLVVLLSPLGAAVACGLAGAAGRNPRRFAVWFSVAHLGLTAVLVGGVSVQLTHRGDPVGMGAPRFHADPGFKPIAVPGDPGFGDANSQAHETAWGLLPLGPRPGPDIPPPEVQFYFGLDGLNVWLVGLASLMTLVAVLVSWDPVTERPGGYYGWLFALQAGIIGALTAFDVILFYVCFELTLVPTFFLIGSWGVGGGRRDAARKFFLYTLFGGLLTLTGLVGIVLTNPTPLHPTSVNAKPLYGPVPTPYGPVSPREGPITFSAPRLMQNVEAWALSKWFQAGFARVREGTAAGRLEDAKARATGPDDPAVQRAEADLRAAERRRTETVAEWDRHRVIQAWLFVALVAGFAVKVPIVPFHTWLPAAYAEAPTAVTMLLTALLAKLGTYGLVRFALPLSPDAALAYGLPVLGTLGAVGIVYAAMCAYAQRDLKLLVAYSSLSHLGFLVVGLFSFNKEGVTGAVLHMVNHGLATGTLFALLGFLAVRYRTLDMNQYGGLWGKFPGYAFFAFLICLASIGLPGLNNFVSEMLMLAGLFDPALTRSLGYGLAVAAAFGILLSAWYTLTMLRRVFFGPLREPPGAVGVVRGPDGRETVAYALPAALCVALGVCPQPVLDTMRADAEVVALFGDHARRKDGSFVERPLPLPPLPPGFGDGPPGGPGPLFGPPVGRPPGAPAGPPGKDLDRGRTP